MLRMSGAIKFTAIVVGITAIAVLVIEFTDAKYSAMAIVVALGAMFLVGFRFAYRSVRRLTTSMDRRLKEMEDGVHSLNSESMAHSAYFKADEQRMREIGQMIKAVTTREFEFKRTLDDLRTDQQRGELRLRQVGQLAQETLAVLKSGEQSLAASQILRGQTLNEGRVRQIGQICNEMLKIIERISEQSDKETRSDHAERAALAEYRATVLHDLALVGETIGLNPDLRRVEPDDVSQPRRK